ncbi:secretin N-terminal domain-containing protein [Polaromonas jejuensis]|uniref:Secretin N-terminal domain-containing protein n=1 Tax=Polaromonas jejuensis TaxID=457502 RepID=A0ABW0QCQ5_9BURK|nr:secretin N-terminal domain-containing protein [Polaromonas jejuensis]
MKLNFGFYQLRQGSGDFNKASLSPKRARVITCISIVLLLAGCAAPRHFNEGQRLIKAGEQEKGLQELREALKLEPNNAQYRLEFRNQQARYIETFVTRGDEQRAAGQLDAAIETYSSVLRMDPQNEMARRKLVQSLATRSATDLTTQAQNLFNAKNSDAAREKVKLALAEDAAYAPALALLKKIDAQADEAKSVKQAQFSAQSVMKRPISLQFRDANLRMVFEAMSRSVGLNVILDRDVRSDLKTTIYVKDASVEDAMDLILLQNQLDKRVLNGNTLFVYPATAVKQKEYQELKVRVFQLSNVDSKYMQNVLKTILKIKDVVIDEKSNTIVIRDTPDAIAVAEKLVTAHDVADAEVMLEVEVLEVSRDRVSNIGIKWPDNVSLNLPNGTGPNGVLTLGELRALGRDQVLFGPAQLGIGFNAKLIDSDANLLASPRIRVRHKEKANILIGDRVPFVSGSNTITAGANPIVSNSVQYLDVGIKLEVEPYVYSENDVGIKIKMEVSNIAKEIPNKNTGDILYQIGTRSASTSLRLKDGETQVLAGLLSDQERSSADKVPGLGQTPLLGRLFSNNNGNTTKTEIVLSITPRIIRGQNPMASAAREIWSGTDTQIRELPLRLDPIGIVRSSSTAGAAPVGPRTAPAVPDRAPVPAFTPPPPPDISTQPASPEGATGSGVDGRIVIPTSPVPPGTTPAAPAGPAAPPDSSSPGSIFSPPLPQATPASPPAPPTGAPTGAEQSRNTPQDSGPPGFGATLTATLVDMKRSDEAIKGLEFPARHLIRVTP